MNQPAFVDHIFWLLQHSSPVEGPIFAASEFPRKHRKKTQRGLDQSGQWSLVGAAGPKRIAAASAVAARGIGKENRRPWGTTWWFWHFGPVEVVFLITLTAFWMVIYLIGLLSGLGCFGGCRRGCHRGSSSIVGQSQTPGCYENEAPAEWRGICFSRCQSVLRGSIHHGTCASSSRREENECTWPT